MERFGWLDMRNMYRVQYIFRFVRIFSCIERDMSALSLTFSVIYVCAIAHIVQLVGAHKHSVTCTVSSFCPFLLWIMKRVLKILRSRIKVQYVNYWICLNLNSSCQLGLNIEFQFLVERRCLVSVRCGEVDILFCSVSILWPLYTVWMAFILVVYASKILCDFRLIW